MTSWFLSTVDAPLCALGLILDLLSLALLYVGWRQSQRTWALLAIGWGLWLVSFWPWMQAMGGDRGFFIPPLLLGTCALLLLILIAPWRLAINSTGAEVARAKPAVGRKPSAPSSTSPSTYLWRRLLQRLGRFLLQLLVSGCLSFCAALAIAFVLFSQMESSSANRLVASALLVLLLWPLLILWCRASRQLRQPAAWLTGISLLGLTLSHWL